VNKTRGLVLFGDSAFAEVAYEYFTRDSHYEVVAFAVERAFRTRDDLFGLPVIAIEDAERLYPPEDQDVYVAVVYTQMNRLRARLCATARSKGYTLATFVSPAAFVGPRVTIGEHCFIFEHNVIQPFVSIGNNVVLWSGNHVGHHSRIDDNVFVSSHVVISGFCTVGKNCFLGVNSALGNNVNVAEDCWIGPGVVLSRDTQAGQIYRPAEPSVAKVDVYRRFRLERE
jgi:sugar O-acyltransferase (sialic acid O-acetyltransferase NeuD family)